MATDRNGRPIYGFFTDSRGVVRPITTPPGKDRKKSKRKKNK